MNKELLDYIETNIIPSYQNNDKAHQENHVRRIICNSMLMAQEYDADKNIVYTAAAYHDLGLSVERARHEIFSKQMMLDDKRLDEFFNQEEKDIIADAIVTHRASGAAEPNTIYGKIAADADRDLVPVHIIERTVFFSLANFPAYDKDGHFVRSYDHIKSKYGQGGYLKLWLDSEVNNDNMKKLRNLIADQRRSRRVFDYYFDQQARLKKPLY